MITLKQRLKQILPESAIGRIREFRFRRLNRKVDAIYAGNNSSAVFSAIYSNEVWGQRPEAEFYSGGGSHEPLLVDPYVKAVAGFCLRFRNRPAVVDLGCGDFNIGRQIRAACGTYIACDVVPQLIEHNRAKFADLDVDFRCLDAAADELPDADVIFIREVLQHLSNEQIAKIVRKLTKYRFLVLTESLPAKPGFSPNLEKRTGPGVRIASGSGIVITAPPFSLPVIAEEDICSITISPMLTRTTVYQLQPLDEDGRWPKIGDGHPAVLATLSMK